MNITRTKLLGGALVALVGVLAIYFPLRHEERGNRYILQQLHVAYTTYTTINSIPPPDKKCLFAFAESLEPSLRKHIERSHFDEQALTYDPNLKGRPIIVYRNLEVR